VTAGRKFIIRFQYAVFKINAVLKIKSKVIIRELKPVKESGELRAPRQRQTLGVKRGDT